MRTDHETVKSDPWLNQPAVLSVIVPTYNAAQVVRPQLEALRDQTYEGDWEIVVADNRSSDETAAIIQAYQTELPRLRLVQAPARQGRGYACNVGARSAHGDAFIFCDTDDVAAPGWLRALAQALAKHAFVAGAIEVERLNQAAPWRPNPHPRPANGLLDPILGFLPYAIGCNLAVRREVFEAVGGFSEDAPFCEDVDLSWRLQLAGVKLAYEPKALMHYRYRTDIGASCRQAALHATGHVYLYKRFAAQGMPPPPRDKIWWRYWWLLRKAPSLWATSPQGREKWLYWASITWGRLRGSLRYRTIYL